MSAVIRALTSTQEDVVNAMHACSLFDDWDGVYIEALAHYLVLQTFKAGTTVVEEGDKGDFLGIVVKGRLSVSKFNSNDSMVELTKLHPGRLFGEMALLDRERRSATVTAVDDCTLMIFSASALDRIRTEAPMIAFEFLRKLSMNLSRRLRSADGRLVDMVGT